MKITREDYIPSPEPGCAVGKAITAYSHPTESWLVQAYHEIRGSDRFDCYWRRWSGDNGGSWTEPQQILQVEEYEAYTVRKGELFFYYDPDVDRVLQIYDRGKMPADDPLASAKFNKLMCEMSTDGGRTFGPPFQIVQQGYDADHYMESVWHGKNSAQTSCSFIEKLSDGTLLFPITIRPLDESGEIYNPGGGHTFSYAAALLGRWNEQASDIEWDLGQILIPDHTRTTRGFCEPIGSELEDGRLLMICRGSNDANPSLRGYKWRLFSSDLGRTWTEGEPLRFADGGELLSPATCSRLIRHSSGELYWFGNILSENPVGNGPRYPLQLARVDERNGGIIRESVVVIDDRQPDECETLQLSNFWVYEDCESAAFLLSMHRLFAERYDQLDWTSPCVRYRIEP